MKGKKKAVATHKTTLSEGMEDGNNMVEVPVRGGNVEGKERQDLDYYNGDNNNNLDEREGEVDDEDNEDEAEDEEGEMEEAIEGGGQGEERVRLDEGFYEIEAIRRKRVRKGQLQYLIKWRGWPETSNTWEPLENLQSCSDFIDAFEESLHSGKSSRKRKRKHGGPHLMPKKKQQLTSTGYNITDVEISVDKTFSTPANNSTHADGQSGSGHEGEKNGTKNAKKADENGHSNQSKQNSDKKEDKEYDPKLSELKGLVSNEDKLAVHFNEGGCDGPVNEVPKLDYVDPVQNKPCTGSKRRKSGSVKRFKKDMDVDERNVTDGVVKENAPLEVESGNLARANLNHKPIAENSLFITKIIKPIGFSSSVVDNVQDVLVSFVALRSDGKEVVVDNQFLKSNNPHLLIAFYEQHLKYNT